MNFKAKWHIGAEEDQPMPGADRRRAVQHTSIAEIVTDDFHAGQCVCGVHVQGNRAIWETHRKVVHGDDGRIDIGMTPDW